MVILSAGLLGLIIYFAVSSKSSRLLRLAAIIALGLIGISIGICGVLLIRGPSQEEVDIILPIFKDAAPKAKSGSNFVAIFVFLAVFLFVVGTIIYLSLRKQVKKEEPVKKTTADPVFPSGDELNIEELGKEENEDSFDIEFK